MVTSCLSPFSFSNRKLPWLRSRTGSKSSNTSTAFLNSNTTEKSRRLSFSSQVNNSTINGTGLSHKLYFLQKWSLIWSLPLRRLRCCAHLLLCKPRRRIPSPLHDVGSSAGNGHFNQHFTGLLRFCLQNFELAMFSRIAWFYSENGSFQIPRFILKLEK